MYRRRLQVLKFFIQQKNLEYLNDKQAKPSPLMKTSTAYIRRNPNPYIQVFDRISRNPNVQSLPPSPIWPRVNGQLTVMANRIWMGASVIGQIRHAQFLADQWVQRENHLAELRLKQELQP